MSGFKATWQVFEKVRHGHRTVPVRVRATETVQRSVEQGKQRRVRWTSPELPLILIKSLKKQKKNPVFYWSEPILAAVQDSGYILQTTHGHGWEKDKIEKLLGKFSEQQTLKQCKLLVVPFSTSLRIVHAT